MDGGGGGWLGIAKIKPTQPQLGLAGAWPELGKINQKNGLILPTYIVLQKRYGKIF